MHDKMPETPGYPYWYETHLHTKESSACARNTAAEMVYAYKEAGYTGIMVTDHFFHGNTAVDRNCSWEDWVEGYCKAYENAKKAGDEVGLTVFFGWEQSYRGTDFIVYGLDKAWLLKHPEIRDASVEEQYRLVHADGGMIVHAHPYREAGYIPEIRLYPEFVDAVEVVNASHQDERAVYNERALEYALLHNFPQTEGSDIHSTKLFGGGMAFARKLENVQDYIEAVKKREGRLLSSFREKEQRRDKT